MKGAYENTKVRLVAISQWLRRAKKKDSGSARKEKQQIRKNVPLPESP
jgi:hypothetical protein